jgi:hypothetical protein
MTDAAQPALEAVSITPISYRDWPNAYVISNGIVEAVVVPSISRIMQFRFTGDEAGVFWENQTVDAADWPNYGGDKTWPAPQESWEAVGGRPWPPPVGFDKAPSTLTIDNQRLVLSSPVDDHYGVQVTREITLECCTPIMRVTTTFTKVCGSPLRIGVWVITQLREPQSIVAPIHGQPPYKTTMGSGFEDVRSSSDLLSIRRAKMANVKLVLGGTSLLWLDCDFVLRIDTNTNHSRGRSHTAVYTNKDPLDYVELETVGPVVMLAPGKSLRQTNIYTLGHRSGDRPEVQARAAFCEGTSTGTVGP